MITETDPARLSSDDAKLLLNWRDSTTEDLVYGFDMHGLLSLYHASSACITLEDWLNHKDGAVTKYKRIKRSIHGPS